MTSRLSIIIPTYNRAGMIGDMVRSIFRQKYPKIEIIVVDDGSADNTREVINDLRSSKERPASIELKYIYQNNSGAPAARNEGIRQSTGAYLMFADSDDEVTEDGIMAAMNAHLVKEVDFVYMRVWEINTRDGPETRKLKGGRYDGSDKELIGHHWHTMAAIYSRKAIDRVGYWLEGVPCSQDWEYQTRVKLYCSEGKYLNNKMGDWKVHPYDRLGTKDYNSKYVNGVFLVCKSIHSHCQRAGRFSDDVRKRLRNRLIRHALEAGAHGDSKLRGEILVYSRNLVRKPFEVLMIKILSFLYTRCTDRIAYRALCAMC